MSLKFINVFTNQAIEDLSTFLGRQLLMAVNQLNILSILKPTSRLQACPGSSTMHSQLNLSPLR